MCNVREEASVKDAIEKTAARFGGIDIVVNNASAIQLTPVTQTDMNRFDLMHQVNARGTFMVSKFAIPYLEKAKNPHILMLSPPLDIKEKWFAPYTAYAMAKYGMSLVVLGLAGELRSKGIAANALWPRTTIATAAVNMLGGDRLMNMSRTPDILSDAAYRIFHKPAREFSGNFLIDDTFLASEGVTDFDQYRINPGTGAVAGFLRARRHAAAEGRRSRAAQVVCHPIFLSSRSRAKGEPGSKSPSVKFHCRFWIPALGLRPRPG